MSKRTWHHPDVAADESTVSWRSLGQLEDTPEFRTWLEREFPRGAAEMADEEDAETSRRSFLKLMGASTALAGFGMAACRRPEQYILPYANAPEWIIPGKAVYYASSFPRAGGAVPLVVTTFDGRPTFVAPNKLHPDANGTDSFVQASVLDLYSPSRSRQTLRGGEPADRVEFSKQLAELAKDGQARIGIVFGRDDSPTRARLRKELASKFPNAKFYAYEALEGEAAKVAGDGRRFVPDFGKADRIVALDSDFTSLDSDVPLGGFFARRKPEGAAYDKAPDAAGMNRVYAIESAFSLTGGLADHRLRVKPSELLAVAGEIARQLGVASLPGSLPQPSDRQVEWVTRMVADLPAGKSLVVAGPRTPEAVQHLAAAINARLDAIGADKPLQVVQTEAAELGDIVQLSADLNSGAVEHLFLFSPSNPVYDAPADLEFGEALAKAKTSIHFGQRTDHTALASTWHVPLAHYLESWGDGRSARGVYTVVQPMIEPLYPDCVSEIEVLAALVSETGALVPELEPGAPTPAYQALRDTFAGIGGEGEAAWKKLLHDGFLADSSYGAASYSPDATALSEAIDKAPQGGGMELIFATDHSVYDGRWIDNGWLQEAPDPISKVSWDNVALIAPQTAKKLGIYDQLVPLESPVAAVPADGEGEHRTGKLVELKVGGQSLVVAVQIGFGQAEDTIYLPLGYGQGFDGNDELGRDTSGARCVGQVGVNTGFNAYPLRSTANPYFAVLDEAPRLTGATYKIAATQEHHSMYGRALAREVSTAEDKKKGDFHSQLDSVQLQGMDSHAPPNISLYKAQDRDGQPLLSDKVHQWGMSIDLASCIGCNACLIACQAENNIPIVGKEQLAKGREMHWIRMDRYYAAQPMRDDHGHPVLDENQQPVVDEENLEMLPQPVACVQCESAPCETVCPVNATVHTEDGLNAMAYNRCIGTRYCANNCPYKARRFNFFDYNKRNPLVPNNLNRGPLGEKQVGTSAHLQRNPNVSVRMRGVMEKCTYCVQRLKDAKIRQKRRQKVEVLKSGDSTATTIGTNELRVPTDSVKVACQEACPSECISFGNLLNPESQLRRIRNEDNSPLLKRNYDLLNYLGTRPRTSYLARVKNPNPEMPGAANIGKATVHMH